MVEPVKNQERKLVPRVSYQGKKPVPFEEYIPLVDLRVKMMAEAKDTLVEIIIEVPDDKLSKTKEEHINELDEEHDKYMEIIRALKTSYEAEVTLAETLLCLVESQPATAVVQTAAGEMFKPQSNLKPSFLDKNSTHLEVKNFCQNVETYIVTGFKDALPQMVWPYIKPLMHATWAQALEQNDAKAKWLQKIINLLLEESNLRNPVHNRRIDFLQSKRQGATHSDFWGILEEKLALIDFQNLTGEALGTHIFLQESDAVMSKMAAQILYETEGKGDVGRLRNEIKAIESSQWYDSRRPHAGKRAGEPGGGRWCEQCKSQSHNTDSCWGKCRFCDRYGHLPSVCWKNPANKDSKGSAKSALLPIAPTAAAPPVPTI